jgi:putative transposase
MLTDDAFEQWCQERHLSQQAKDLILRIRSSPPSRLVQSAAGNVSGRYPSPKMQCSIQFESRRGELTLIYQLEHDPTVLEYFDQPNTFNLTYPNKTNTRRVTASHTPDFFVIYKDRCGWIECKMEEKLLQLTQEMPYRYVPNADGTWSCPPGAAYAEQFGFFYRVHSSREIGGIYQRNFRFLEDYLRGSRPPVPSEVVISIRTTMMRMPGISLLDLLHSLDGGTADDVYALIITDQLYVNLSQTPLTDPEHVQVFLDREIGEEYETLSSSSVSQPPRPFVLSIEEGTQLWWDGKSWTVFHQGETAITLLSEDRQVKPVPHQVFDALLQQGMLTGLPSQIESNQRTEERMLLELASPKHLEVATERVRALGKRASVQKERQASLRTLQRWRAKARNAEAVYGSGYVGLLPKWGNSGN